MAGNVNVWFGSFMGAGAPCYGGCRVAETVVSSGTSQQTVNTSVGGEWASITVQSTGTDILVAWGDNAVASATTGKMVTPGATIDVGPLKAGDKIAIIDA